MQLNPQCSLQKEENKRKNRIANGTNGAYTSSGSIGNPMYQAIHTRGFYIPTTARNYRRAKEREMLKNLRSEKVKVSKFHKGFLA